MRHDASRVVCIDRTNFNPRTPYGMRQKEAKRYTELKKFQSTHPLRDATTFRQLYALTERISIHAPLTGCDSVFECHPKGSKVFQSTHPLRDATSMDKRQLGISLFQSTHPLRDATIVIRDYLGWIAISIHAPLTGCDTFTGLTAITIDAFQSTHPLRDATFLTQSQAIRLDYFNPRTPYGMRHYLLHIWLNYHLFQSTHPLRDATKWLKN